MTSTTSRRGILGAAVMLPAAALAPAVSFQGAADPVLALCRTCAESGAAGSAASDQGEEVREALTRRYGAVSPTTDADTLWGHHPDFPKMLKLNALSDRHMSRYCDLITQIMETPAQSLAGVLAKVRMALAEYPPNLETDDETEYWQLTWLAVLKDAERFLSGSVQA